MLVNGLVSEDLTLDRYKCRSLRQALQMPLVGLYEDHRVDGKSTQEVNRRQINTQTSLTGQPWWCSSLAPPAARGVILETWDPVPRQAPCVEPASPSASVSASLSLSLSLSLSVSHE